MHFLLWPSPILGGTGDPHDSIAAFHHFVLLTLTSALKAVDKEQLRRAISLPRISVCVGYGLNDQGEFIHSSERVPETEKIANIENEMKGDATDAERHSRLVS